MAKLNCGNHSLSVSLEMVDSAKAEKYLEHNFEGNRRLNRKTVDLYKTEMRTGGWRLTHQGIAFCGTGGDDEVLVDGQHTLHAIQEEGVCIPLLVIRGLEKSAYPAIDAGVPKTPSIRFEKEKRLTEILLCLDGLCRGFSGRCSTSAFAVLHKTFSSGAERVLEACPSTRRRVSRSAVRAAFTLAVTTEPDRAEEICAQFRRLVLAEMGDDTWLSIRTLGVQLAGEAANAVMGTTSSKDTFIRTWKAIHNQALSKIIVRDIAMDTDVVRHRIHEAIIESCGMKGFEQIRAID